jgi:hypothetical protein
MTWRAEDVQEGDTLKCLRWYGVLFTAGKFYRVVTDHLGASVVEANSGAFYSVYVIYCSKESFEHIPMNLEND